MIFTDGQLAFLESRARYQLITLKAAMGDKDEYIIGHIMNEQKECCSMGYSIAQDVVCSTPWEFLFQSMSPSANENEAEANKHASLGWEYLNCDGRWVIWRRRRAVAEIIAAKKNSE